MEGKSSSQNAEFEHFFTFLPIDNVRCDVLTVEFFITKLMQICRRMRLNQLNFSRPEIFFSEKRMMRFFEKKNLNFFETGKGGNVAVECVSNSIMS